MGRPTMVLRFISLLMNRISIFLLFVSILPCRIVYKDDAFTMTKRQALSISTPPLIVTLIITRGMWCPLCWDVPSV